MKTFNRSHILFAEKSYYHFTFWHTWTVGAAYHQLSVQKPQSLEISVFILRDKAKTLIMRQRSAKSSPRSQKDQGMRKNSSPRSRLDLEILISKPWTIPRPWNFILIGLKSRLVLEIHVSVSILFLDFLLLQTQYHNVQHIISFISKGNLYPFLSNKQVSESILIFWLRIVAT